MLESVSKTSKMSKVGKIGYKLPNFFEFFGEIRIKQNNIKIKTLKSLYENNQKENTVKILLKTLWSMKNTIKYHFVNVYCIFLSFNYKQFEFI